MDAVHTMQDEHRSIAAVLHGMLYLVREIRLRAATPNFRAFHAMVYYVDTFVDRFHHPKEDAYLFRLLRLRYADSAPLIAQLESEHRASTGEKWLVCSRRSHATRPKARPNWAHSPRLCSPTLLSTGVTCASKRISSFRLRGRTLRPPTGTRSTRRSPDIRIRCSDMREASITSSFFVVSSSSRLRPLDWVRPGSARLASTASDRGSRLPRRPSSQLALDTR